MRNCVTSSRAAAAAADVAPLHVRAPPVCLVVARQFPVSERTKANCSAASRWW